MKMKIKRITKKYIDEVLRTMDCTAIYELYFQVNGKKASDSWEVAKFIEVNAPTRGIYRAARDIVYKRPYDERMLRAENEYKRANPYSVEMHRLRYYMAQGYGAYTKIPILGKTHLYWCSSNYCHSDYNKHSTLLIKGNERFCELICRVAQRWLDKQRTVIPVLSTGSLHS